MNMIMRVLYQQPHCRSQVHPPITALDSSEHIPALLKLLELLSCPPFQEMNILSVSLRKQKQSEENIHMLFSANLPAFVPALYSCFPSCCHAGSAHCSSLGPVSPQVSWIPPLLSTQEYPTTNHPFSYTGSFPSACKYILNIYASLHSHHFPQMPLSRSCWFHCCQIWWVGLAPAAATGWSGH